MRGVSEGDGVDEETGAEGTDEEEGGDKAAEAAELDAEAADVVPGTVCEGIAGDDEDEEVAEASWDGAETAAVGPVVAAAEDKAAADRAEGGAVFFACCCCC